MSTSFAVTPPADITIPVEGSTTVRELLSTYLRLQFRSLVSLPMSELAGDPAGDAFREHVRALAKSDPGLLFTILRKPTIGGLIRLIVTRDGDRRELASWAREIMAQLSFELATAGCAEGTFPVDGAFPRLISLQRGRSLDLPPGSRSVTFDGSTVRVEAGAASLEVDMASEEPAGTQRTHFPIVRQVALATVDNNPRAGIEAHPDKAGNHCDLGVKPADEWVDSLRQAWGFIEAFTPELLPELDMLIHQMVPVGYEPEKHLSASLMEVIGNIYLSLHPDPLVMAEAVIHEFQHNKINVLWTLAPLLENAFQPLYASPVRPDPRPLFGVLLAVHAFLPVEKMYVGLAASDHPVTRHPRFDSRRRQIRKLNDEAATTVLTNGIWTPAGAPVAEEIRRLNAELAASP